MEVINIKYKEIGKIKSGKRLPKGEIVSEEKSDNKYIRVRDITNNYIKANDVQYITDNASLKIKNYRVKQNDIIISVVGTVGSIAEIPEELDGAYLTENCDNLLVDESKCLKKYLFYYLTSNWGKEQVNANTVGSTQPKLPIYGIENFNIVLPSIEEQAKIVKVLDCINKKIRINNKTSDNLFKLCCLDYKKWHKELSENEETAYKNLKELGNVVMGQSPKGESYNFNKEGLPLINGAADYENGFLKAQKYTSMPTKTCKKDDLIFCIRATIGLLTISDKEYCLGRGVAGIVDIDKEYREYAYHLIYNSIEEFKKLATGSVIVGISRNDIEDIRVKIPTEEQIKLFHKTQYPIFRKIQNIRNENNILIKLNNILLPRLINGEIDLGALEV